MTKTAAAGISLANLNARKTADVPFEFEYIGPDGELSGVFLKVIGSESDTIVRAIQAEDDAERRANYVRATKNAKARPESADLGSMREDMEANSRKIARRLVGWRGPGEIDGLSEEQRARFLGIEEPWSAENALLLCSANTHLANQVIAKANDLGNFMRLSPPKS
jgi:hypothetical protein